MNATSMGTPTVDHCCEVQRAKLKPDQMADDVYVSPGRSSRLA